MSLDSELLRNLYIRDNLSIRQIARKLGRSFRCVQLKLQKLGIKKHDEVINETRNQNVKAAMLLKYGTEHYMTSASGYARYRDKLQQNLGVTNIMQLSSTKAHRAQTCLGKYGVDHDLKAPIVREKMKQTLLERYGVDNTFKSKKIMAQSLSRRRIINGYWGKGQHVETRFGSIFVRSSYEKKFLEILIQLNCIQTLIYEPFVVPVNGSEYIPDFFINDYIIIEVKPKRFIFPLPTDNNFVKKIAVHNQAKHQALTEWSKQRNYSYFLVTEAEITRGWCDRWLIPKP